MNHSMKNRLVAMLLAVCTILGMGVPASASSVQDGSKTCTISPETRHKEIHRSTQSGSVAFPGNSARVFSI